MGASSSARKASRLIDMQAAPAVRANDGGHNFRRGLAFNLVTLSSVRRTLHNGAMRFVKRLPQLAAAALFTVSAATAVFIGDASRAGQPAQGLLSSAPQVASAAVSVGIGVAVGAPYRYYRYAYRGGAWVRVGFAYAAAPGYVGGYYLGYGPPVGYYAPRFYRPYVRPYYGLGYRRYPYYARPYYGRPYYAHPYYGWRR